MGKDVNRAALRVLSRQDAARRQRPRGKVEVKKDNDYSPARKSPLRNTITARDISSSSSSTSAESLKAHRTSSSHSESDLILGNPVRLSLAKIGKPESDTKVKVDLGSPTRLSFTERSRALNTSPQRLSKSTQRIGLSRIDLKAPPSPAFGLRHGKERSLTSPRTFNLKKRASGEELSRKDEAVKSSEDLNPAKFVLNSAEPLQLTAVSSSKERVKRIREDLAYLQSKRVERGADKTDEARNNARLDQAIAEIGQLKKTMSTILRNQQRIMEKINL